MSSLPFEQRVSTLPRLGVGISTEYGAGGGGLDVNGFARRHPDLVDFMEVGADLERGIDEATREWAAAGRPTTYHFLDVNLEEPESIDQAWSADTAKLAREIGAAWLCGDAGLWHVGPRDRGHGILMPPILVAESAEVMARAVRRVREETGFEVLPENPPAHLFLGDLHLLDYFARVSDEADCGLLLDVAHLAIYQHVCGHGPLDGFDGYPLDRVVEVHVAAGTEFVHGGKTFIDDDHGVDVLPETWEILDYVLERGKNVRAVVYECERNTEENVIPVFRRLAEMTAS